MLQSEKLQLLITVSKLYYIENLTQGEIAKILGVSRPLISKYLQEAKSLGVVKIEINEFSNQNKEDEIIKKLCQQFNLKNISIIPSSANEELNNQMFIDYLNSYLLSNYVDNSLIGLGWGSVIGDFINKFEPLDNSRKKLGKIVPIIGNAPISYRNYHTNELVRMFAEKSGLKCEYLYAPVICSNSDQKDLFMNIDQVKTLFKYYKKLDYIVSQIRNFPSVPDLATEARFEKLLQENHACGMVLGYYFNVDGEIITSPHDYSIQIPLKDFRSARVRVGIMNSKINTNAAIGALRTGLFNDILITENLLQELLSKGYIE